MANKGLFREYDALAYNKDTLEGPGDRHRAVNHVKKGKKGAEVVFNPQAHKEYLTGFRKRKLQRRKVAQKQLEVKAKQQRIEERAERRTKLKHELGLPDNYGVGSSSSDEEPEVDIKEDERAQVTVYNDGQVTTRVSVVDMGVPGASSDDGDDGEGTSGREDDKSDEAIEGQAAQLGQHRKPQRQQQQRLQRSKAQGKKGKQVATQGHASGSKKHGIKGKGSLGTKQGKVKKQRR